MRLRYLVSFLLIFWAGSIYSQDVVKDYNDKVYLNNGSLLIGEIVDYNPGESVTLELENGKILQFSSKQVRKVKMNAGEIVDAVSSIKTGRIYNETQFSLLLGESGSGLSMAHNVLYQLNTEMAIGLGAGIDNYYAEAARDIFPIFVNVKYYLMDLPSSVYIGSKAGYGMIFKNENENLVNARGGMMWNPYFGLRVRSSGIIINLFTGLKFQKASYEFDTPWENRQEEIYFRRIEVGSSVMF